MEFVQEKKSHHPKTPLPLMKDEEKATRYPIESLPRIMRDAAEAIAEHVQAPLGLAGSCVIGAATHLAQTRVNAVNLNNPAGMPCSLYILALGMSGDRKSACRDLAFCVIDKAEQKARQLYKQRNKEILNSVNQLKGKAREEFLISNPIPADPGRQYTDATFEPIAGDFIRGKSAASWDTDEGGQFFNGASLKADTRVATLGGLCKAYDRGVFERRRAAGNLETSGTAEHRRLSIHLMAQPAAVGDALKDPILLQQGFLPRFLLSNPDSIAGTRTLSFEQLAHKSYNDSRLHNFWQRCEEIIASPEYIDPETQEVHPPVLELDKLATLAWLDFYNPTELEQGPLGKYTNMRPFAGRAPEIALRLAAVFACIEGANQIDADCMNRACSLVEYSLSEWLHYTEGEKTNPTLRQARDLLEWLRAPCRALSWTEFHRDKFGKSGPSAMRPAKVRDKLLTILVNHHYLLSSDNKTFQMNPLAKFEDRADPQQLCDLTGEEYPQQHADIGHESRLSAMLRKLSAEAEPRKS